jgi:hypothetical protein
LQADVVIEAALNAGEQILTDTQRLLCLFCDSVRFDYDTTPAVFIVLTALRDDPSTAMVHCLRREWFGDEPQGHLQQQLLVFYQANIDPSFCRIELTHGSTGRA